MAILLLEDRDEDAELIKMALADHVSDPMIIWKKDGEEAIEFLFSKPDSAAIEGLKVIFLDINLPKVNGLELLRKIKNSSLKHIPVVILTTSDQPKDLTAAYDNYVNSYVVKSPSFKQFKSVVHQVADYWLQINLMP